MSVYSPQDGVYIDKGDYCFHSVDGKLITCVVCRKPLEYGKESKLCRHKCSKRVYGAIEAANTRLEEPLLRKPPFEKRLSDGFYLLRELESL